MRVLTDTHSLVWALCDPDLLSKKARKVLSEAEVTASVANLWELLLKVHKQDALLTDPLAWWGKYVLANGIPTLSIRTPHVMALGNLEDFHRDPFDRILVAQAKTESLPLVSKDGRLKQYGIEVIW